MSDQTTTAMTPDKLLEGYDYAVVRDGYADQPYVSNLFGNKESATVHAATLNEYADVDAFGEYSVVRIEHDRDRDRELLEGDCEMFQSRSERLSTAMVMICDDIKSECKKLRDRHDGESYHDMSKFDDYRYNMDCEAHSTMSAVYALISGATLAEYGGMMPSFPIPDYD